MAVSASLFDYELPEELIALRPASCRDKCRLMVIDRENGKISGRTFDNLVDLLGNNDFLVINNTKVRNARLDAYKMTGGKSEFFVINVLSSDKCEALVKGHFKEGAEIIVSGHKVKLLKKSDDGIWLADTCGVDIEELAEKSGHIPLPPYINRKDDEKDKTDYQTVYAEYTGSAAAPTAGLHFTENLLEKLKKKGVEIVAVTLDVGIGTFRPVKSENFDDHIMHSENYRISEEAADKINFFKKNGKKLTAVGTTVVRTLESASSEKGEVSPSSSSTNLFIMPGYKFKIVDKLITNFHLPKSTLIALTAAFGGYDLIMDSYRTAVKEKYRFFSYGDAMLII